MEFEFALLAEIAKSFEARAVGGGVELGGDDDHGFFGEGRAEGYELAIDDLEGMDGIIGVRIARVNEMNEEARAFDVAKEADAEAGAKMRAFNEAGEIGDEIGRAHV